MNEYSDYRAREFEQFEARARGELPHRSKRLEPTDLTAASVLTKQEQHEMSLFQTAKSTSAYLKMGMLGFAGSGKTKTAALTAIGLVKHMQLLGVDYANRPVFFLDTEKGSDWVRPGFAESGIALATLKSRAFANLLQAVPEAQANGSVLIIDSISHYWKELCETYQKSKAAQYKKSTYKLQFQDWGWLKSEWASSPTCS